MPQYRVLVYVGREFGNLLSMICRHDKIGRMLFRTNSDPFTMLSHALGVTKTRCDETSIPMARKVHDTALYLNEKVHTLSKLLIEQRKKDPVGACMFSLELFSSIVNPRRACAARVTVVVLCVCVCVCVFVCPGRSSATHATKRQTRHTHGLSILVAPE